MVKKSWRRSDERVFGMKRKTGRRPLLIYDQYNNIVVIAKRSSCECINEVEKLGLKASERQHFLKENDYFLSNSHRSSERLSEIVRVI